MESHFERRCAGSLAEEEGYSGFCEGNGGYMAFDTGDAAAVTTQQKGGRGFGSFRDYLDTRFTIRARGSTVEAEIRAGLVTWVTMSYIAVVNPTILSTARADGSAPVPFHMACMATCLSAAFASGFVGVVANLPFGLAAGMGLNTYFRYGAIGRMGLSPQAALAACATQAILFIALAASGAVDRMQSIVPSGIKSAITVAIGIFQAFAGFQLMGLVVKSDETLVELGDITRPGLWLSMTATLFVAAMLVRRTKGALLLGICFTTVASHLLGIYTNSAPGAVVATATSPHTPDLSGRDTSGELHSLGLDFSALFTDPQSFGSVVLCMLFIVVFDTAGVQHGLGEQAGLLGNDERLPGANAAYLASAFGTGLGAILGTSPVIIHNESAAGVQEGGRTGLCAVVTAVLFLFSPMLVPLIELVPPEATAPCLVLVGTMMMGPVGNIDFGDLRVALPAFLIITVTPLAYSISAGVFMGIASYFVLGAVLWVADTGTTLGDSIGSHLFPGKQARYRNVEERYRGSIAYESSRLAYLES